MATLVSVNIGEPCSFEVRGRGIRTGIFKEPIEERVQVDTLGLVGDHVLNEFMHGGPDQAVYVYRAEAYNWWRRELAGLWPETAVEDARLQPGGFGENLTVEGLPDEGKLAVGDRIEIGSVLLELTAPRIPCDVFAEKMGDKQLPKRMIATGRSGFYCRVLQTGELAVGDRVAYTPLSVADRISIRRFVHDYHRAMNAATLRAYLAQPIDVRFRIYLQRQMQKAESCD